MSDENVDDLIGVEPPGVVEGLSIEEREDEFLRLLGRGCHVREAAVAVAISFSTLYKKRDRDPDFAKRWDEAKRVKVGHLIAEAERRAIKGSDKLLIFLLQSYDPARFRHREMLDLTNSDGSLRAQPEDGDAAARTEALLLTARMRKAAREVQDLL